MTEFKAIETQEQLNAIIKARLDREKEKYADYDQLAEKIKKLETENTSLKQTITDKETSESTSLTRISELEKDVTTWKQKSLKQQIAMKNGLPFDLADRLQGDSEESLNEDAERLASLVNVKNYTQPLADKEPNFESKGTDAAWRDVVKNLK
jgi:phage protein|nr:MAG TPA: major capsid protein [Caudoviricetes sp.]